MQPLVTDIRSSLTVEQVTAMIKTDPTMRIGAGIELLDRDLVVQADFSNELVTGEVRRSNYATLHASCSFRLTTELNWGSAVVRPYMLIETDTGTARFNLGAYFTNIPNFVTGESPAAYDVEGYDILQALDTPVGDSYSLNQGVDYLTAVENILINQGYTKYLIDSSRVGTTLPTGKGWPMADNVTWLTVVNDLLSAIGYRGIYSDWNGYLICEPYQSPTERTSEWTYDDGQYTSQLGPQQTIQHDYYATPNNWVGVRSNLIDGASPVEGDGIFTYTNYFDGETSVEARNRTITKRIDIEAADQSALETAVMTVVSSDTRVGTNITAETTPNPLHWHFDVFDVETDDLGIVKVQQSSWSLPLDGGMMQHEWAVI